MKQKEMSNYLKMITTGIAILLLLFVVWFLPTVLKDVLYELGGKAGYSGVIALIWATAIPCFLCLGIFWGICTRIGKDRSFTMDNADALKKMSFLMMGDSVVYVVFLLWYFVVGWAKQAVWLVFPIVLGIFICVTLSILCAALSHLVQKASVMQEEQELTI